MRSIRALSVAALAAFALPAFAQESRVTPPQARRPLNQAFAGHILELKKRKVTIHYDFEDKAQLADFEVVRPPRLLTDKSTAPRIEHGRLVLEGSAAIRHRMEGIGKLHAEFVVRPGKLRNVGAVITEPILSDFYVVYNLFDQRFNRTGNLHVGACGLREDEGAEDARSGLVNFRDIVNLPWHKEVQAGQDLSVEVSKHRWKEFIRVGKKKGKGSSKGKTRDMRTYQFGLFVDGSRAEFDDLTITVELSEEFLSTQNLRAEIEPKPAKE